MTSFATTNASLCRVPRRTLSSMLKMSVLMFASTALFQRSTAVCVGANTDHHDETNARQLLLRGSSPSFDDRLLFDPRAPFDFYNDACEAECQGNEDLTLFDNVCPKCPEKYESQHCNHCCYGGASSLRLRWHGCPGEVTFVSVEQGVQDCQLEADDRSPTDGIRFISCSCYNTINTPETFDPSACQPLSTSIALTSDYGIDSDICIVSVDELDNGDAIINLSKPLPSVIGLVHSPLDEQDQEYTSQYWNPYPFRTYFDTTCSIIDEETAPYVLPLFPGYGKIPSSCPELGFIDLEEPDTPLLPDDIDHYNGEPLTELFWYEFVDGTSVGFWPTGDEESDDYYFNPTFAVCACNDCDGTPPSTPAPGTSGPPTPNPVVDPTPAPQSPPTLSPVEDPTSAPQNPPTVGPVVDPTPAPQNPPTVAPVTDPTAAPQNPPTGAPVADPTAAPQNPPTTAPVVSPTPAPQSPPTTAPVVDPTPAPVTDPTEPTLPGNPGPGGPPTPAPVVSPTPAPVTSAPQDSPVLSPVFSPIATPEPTLPGNPGPGGPPTSSPVAPTVEPVATPAPTPVVEETTLAPVDHDCPPTPAPTTPSNPGPGGPSTPPSVAPTHSPSSSPSSNPVDPTFAPSPSPTPSPSSCDVIDYANCLTFAATKCKFNGQGGAVGETCTFQADSGRRKLKALKTLVGSYSTADFSTLPNDLDWFTKEWILAEKDRHLMASASLMFE